MSRKKKTRSIVIIGRRWFDKVNCNTYFSAVIYVNGLGVHNIEQEYGYSEMYIQESVQWLMDNNYLPDIDNESRRPIWRYCEDYNISLITHVSDVGRKENL